MRADSVYSSPGPTSGAARAVVVVARLPAAATCPQKRLRSFGPERFIDSIPFGRTEDDASAKGWALKPVLSPYLLDEY